MYGILTVYNWDINVAFYQTVHEQEIVQKEVRCNEWIVSVERVLEHLLFEGKRTNWSIAFSTTVAFGKSVLVLHLKKDLKEAQFCR